MKVNWEACEDRGRLGAVVGHVHSGNNREGNIQVKARLQPLGHLVGWSAALHRAGHIHAQQTLHRQPAQAALLCSRPA